MTNVQMFSEERNVKFVYCEDQGRRVTVAYYYDDENECIRTAKAECSKRDRFVKRIGREVSCGRLAFHGGTRVSFHDLGGSSYKNVAKWIRENLNKIA